MALVVFLRGVNVGGHRTFRPSMLVRQLEHYDAVSIGAAGTFVIRKPASQAKLRAELKRRLPFETQVMICTGRDLITMASRDPFANERFPSDIVPFVSVLARRPRVLPPLPVRFPEGGAWLVRVIGAENQFVFGVYRRQMKTIRYLGMIDKLFGAPAITRNWNTFHAIVKVLKSIPTKSGMGMVHKSHRKDSKGT